MDEFLPPTEPCDHYEDHHNRNLSQTERFDTTMQGTLFRCAIVHCFLKRVISDHGSNHIDLDSSKKILVLIGIKCYLYGRQSLSNV